MCDYYNTRRGLHFTETRIGSTGRVIYFMGAEQNLDSAIN